MFAFCNLVFLEVEWRMEPGASLLKHVLPLSCIPSHSCHFKNSKPKKKKKKTAHQCGHTHNPRALSEAGRIAI